MAAFLTTIKHELMPRRRAEPSTLKHWAIEKGEFLGASYLAGRLNAQYGDKVKFRGVEYTYGVGLLGLAMSLASDVFGFGVSNPHLTNICTAFVGAHCAALGANAGVKARQLPSASVPSLPAAKKTVAGAIGEAPQPGKYLDLNEVSRIAAMHG